MAGVEWRKRRCGLRQLWRHAIVITEGGLCVIASHRVHAEVASAEKDWHPLRILEAAQHFVIAAVVVGVDNVTRLEAVVW